MDTFLEFLQSDQVKGILLGLFIFFVTIVLVVRRWIGFSATFLFLSFALAASFLVNHHSAFNTYLTTPTPSKEAHSQFDKQIEQAVSDLNQELKSEKEQLNRVVSQVQELFSVVESEKEKVERLIEDTKEHFKK